MKKAIAMKCNQEQWDAIKGKLVGCSISDIEIFEQDYYLINNYASVRNSITNFWKSEAKGNNREFHEMWNEQVFLEACGIETEKTFKLIELQYWSDKDNKWNSLTSGEIKYRLKPDYSKEIAELERQIEILKNK
jgi:hypothetical protein